MTLKYLFISFFLSSSLVLASPISDYAPNFVEDGQCSDASFIEDFDVEKYSGIWYHTMMIHNAYELASQCSMEYFAVNGDDFIIETRGLDVLNDSVSQTAVVSIISEPDEPPAYQVSSSGIPAVPYVIIDTDYSSYSCVYSCFGFFYIKAELFWVFSRNINESDYSQEKCFQALKRNGIDASKLKFVDQNDPICKNLEAFDSTQFLPVAKKHPSSLKDIIDAPNIENNVPVDNVPDIINEVIELIDLPHGKPADVENSAAGELRNGNLVVIESDAGNKILEPKLEDLCGENMECNSEEKNMGQPSRVISGFMIIIISITTTLFHSSF